MSEIPQSKDDLTLRHHIAHYTLLPTVVIGIIGTLAPFPLWYIGWINYYTALLLPWVFLYGLLVWIWLFGEFVIPKQSYKRLKRGEYD